MSPAFAPNMGPGCTPGSWMHTWGHERCGGSRGVWGDSSRRTHGGLESLSLWWTEAGRIIPTMRLRLDLVRSVGRVCTVAQNVHVSGDHFGDRVPAMLGGASE